MSLHLALLESLPSFMTLLESLSSTIAVMNSNIVEDGDPVMVGALSTNVFNGWIFIDDGEEKGGLENRGRREKEGEVSVTL